MTNNNRILLIEDDRALAKSIATFLTHSGFYVKHFINGDNLASLIEGGNFDLILCDVMLPGTDGFSIAKRLRHTFNGPFIFMSALAQQQDQLQGFALGADDYITKPIEPDLLLARINACLRRHLRSPDTPVMFYENLKLNKTTRQAILDDTELALSKYEFELLWLLLMNQGQHVSREYLFINTVGREYDGMDRTIDGRVSRLRKKLEQFAELPFRIETVWGEGYLLMQKA